MTEAEIITAIKASPALLQLAVEGRDGEIAKAIAPESIPKPFVLTTAHILKEFNRTGSPHAGGVMMKKLRDLATINDPLGNNTAEIVRLMDGDGWQLLDDATVPILQAWKALSVLTDAQIATIRDLATESVRPHFQEVSKALKPFRPDGKIGPLVGI